MCGCWWGTGPQGPRTAALPEALAAILIVVVTSFAHRRGARCLVLALLLVAGAGILAGAGAAKPPAASALHDLPPGPRGLWQVRGAIVSDPQRMSSSWALNLQVDAILVNGVWRAWPLRVHVAVYDPVSQPAWVSGDRFEAFLPLRSDRPARNPLVAARAPLRASGADLRASLKSFRQLRRLPSAGWDLPGLSRARSAARRAIERRFGANAPLFRALLLGERGEVPANVNDALARTGLIHLIAISGLHVGIVLGALFVALRLGGVARPWAALACLAALPLLYGFVVPRPAVARACLMAALVLAGLVAGRRTSALNGLALASLALSIADPWVVRNNGFQLSTAATAAILLLARVPAGGPVTRFVLGSVTVSASAFIAVAPVLAATTHRLPLASVPLNLVAVPTMSVAVIAASAGLAADACSFGPLAVVLTQIADGALELLLRLATAADARVGSLPVAAPAVPWMLPASLIAGATAYFWTGLRGSPAVGPPQQSRGQWARRPSAGRVALATSCVLAGAGFLTALHAEPLPVVDAFRLVAFDIGQGDALLVETPTMRVMVDTAGSPIGDFDPGVSILAPALRARGVRSIDGVAITHLHADHVGGLGGLLGEIPAAGIWVPSIDARDAAGSRLLAAAGSAPLLSLASGQRRDDGDCSWTVLHPSTPWLRAGGAEVSNDGSLVLQLACGKRSLLLTGDTGAAAERRYLDAALSPRGAVLKSPHHGSDTSSTAALLEAAAPRHVVVSAGWRNRFGLPDGEILERYRRRQMAVYRTDRDGAVTLSAGTRIRVRGERWSAGRGRYRVGGWLD